VNLQKYWHHREVITFGGRRCRTRDPLISQTYVWKSVVFSDVMISGHHMQTLVLSLKTISPSGSKRLIYILPAPTFRIDRYRSSTVYYAFDDDEKQRCHDRCSRTKTGKINVIRLKVWAKEPCKTTRTDEDPHTRRLVQTNIKPNDQIKQIIW